MRVFSASSLTALHTKLCDALVLAEAKDLDVIRSVDVQIHDVMAHADSLAWEFDLKDMWLTPGRWSMMVKQYLDPETVQAWLDQIGTRIGKKGPGQAVMRTNIVKPRGGDATGHTNKTTRRWGSCMLAVGYRANPRPEITLHSRTSYLGYIGALDLSVAQACGRYVANEVGLAVEDISFTWFNESIQWHNFKSAAYLLNNPNPKVRQWGRAMLLAPTPKGGPNPLGLEPLNREQILLLQRSPALLGSRKWFKKVLTEDEAGRTYGDMNYNTFRRIIRRYHTEVLGYERAQQFEGWSCYKTGERAGEQKEFFPAYKPLSSVPIATKDFKNIGIPFGDRYSEGFVGGADEDEDDEED